MAGSGQNGRSSDLKCGVPEKAEPGQGNLAEAKLGRVDLAKADLAKVDLAKVDLAKVDLAKVDLAKVDLAKVGLNKVDPAKVDPAKVDPAKVDPAKVDLAKVGLAKVDPAKADLAKVDPAKVDLAKLDLAKVDLVKVDLAKVDQAKANLAKSYHATASPPKPIAAKNDPSRAVETKASPGMADPANPSRSSSAKVDPVKDYFAKAEMARVHPVNVGLKKPDPVKAYFAQSGLAKQGLDLKESTRPDACSKSSMTSMTACQGVRPAEEVKNPPREVPEQKGADQPAAKPPDHRDDQKVVSPGQAHQAAEQAKPSISLLKTALLQQHQSPPKSPDTLTGGSRPHHFSHGGPAVKSELVSGHKGTVPIEQSLVYQLLQQLTPVPVSAVQTPHHGIGSSPNQFGAAPSHYSPASYIQHCQPQSQPPMPTAFNAFSVPSVQGPML